MAFYIEEVTLLYFLYMLISIGLFACSSTIFTDRSFVVYILISAASKCLNQVDAHKRRTRQSAECGASGIRGSGCLPSDI